MTTTPTLEPRLYHAQPSSTVVMMRYDGTDASFHAIKDWLASTFPGENMVSADNPEDNWFSLGSPRLVNHFSQYHLGTGTPEHLIRPGYFIWIDENLTINSSSAPPRAVVEYCAEAPSETAKATEIRG